MFTRTIYKNASVVHYFIAGYLITISTHDIACHRTFVYKISNEQVQRGAVMIAFSKVSKLDAFRRLRHRLRIEQFHEI